MTFSLARLPPLGHNTPSSQAGGGEARRLAWEASPGIPGSPEEAEEGWRGP